jgi:predicted RNase H-like HicB family nuclease
MSSYASKPSSLITVTHEDDWYAAKDEKTGVASQGETRAEAISNLGEALSLHEQPVDEADIPEPDAPWF